MNNLKPFKRLCVTVGNLPTAYIESMSYYEALTFLVKYLEKEIIPSINTNADNIEILNQNFNELKSYVEHYFDNLDVQEEINNKLDDMAEQGQLTDIIAQYLGLAGVLAFDTLDELKAAENIVDGSITLTLGRNSFNDGKTAYYKIREIENNDVIDDDNIIAITYNNDLVGEKIKNFNSIQDVNYITDICTLSYRHSSDTKGLQGGCYCGNNLIACYFTSTHTIQIISLLTGSVVREYSNSIFGHGNGMCKVGDYLYLLGTGDNSTNYVYKIPFNSLNSYEVIDPFDDDLIPAGSNISSICYSPISKHFFITLGLPFPTLYVYEMNDTFTELINAYEIPNDEVYGGFVTNICYWNGFIVVNYNYGKTQFFNENNFILFKEVTINKNVGNRFYSEVQWLDSFENNELIIGAICDSGEGYGNGVYSFGKCNLYNSVRDYPGHLYRGLNVTGEINHRQNTVYVDTTADFSVKRDGTFVNPFISIYEATNSAQLDDFIETIIYIKSGSDISTESIYLANNHIVKIYNATDNGTCAGIRLQNNENVYIRGLIPSSTLYVKESNCTLLIRPTSKTNLDLDVYNTSILNLDVSADKLTLTGSNKGVVNFTQNREQSGLVGILNADGDDYLDFIDSNIINNVSQRGRLAGADYTPSNSMIFFTNPYTTIKSIGVQVGTMYVDLQWINSYHDIEYNMLLPDSTTLNVKITFDSATYTDRTVKKFELTHASLTIFDSIICY